LWILESGNLSRFTEVVYEFRVRMNYYGDVQVGMIMACVGKPHRRRS
jgi:hypothetical protein